MQIIPKPTAWEGKTYPREKLTAAKQDVSVVRVESPNQFFVQPLHFLAMVEDLVREIEAFTEGKYFLKIFYEWFMYALPFTCPLGFRTSSQVFLFSQIFISDIKIVPHIDQKKVSI